MSERGGQPGNKNATKNKPVSDAIRRVLLSNDGEKMRKLAEAIVDRAIETSDAAAKEVFERAEGKVQQDVGLSGDLTVRFDAADEAA